MLEDLTLSIKETSLTSPRRTGALEQVVGQILIKVVAGSEMNPLIELYRMQLRALYAKAEQLFSSSHL